MNEKYEIFILNRELEQITLEYYVAPSKLKPIILRDILLFRTAIELLKAG